MPACEEKGKGDGQDPYRILKEGGIVIGMTKCGQKEKIHYIADDTHTLTIGATRSGKTRTLVLQSICLMALAGESLVISDPKAELYQYAAPFWRNSGLMSSALTSRIRKRAAVTTCSSPSLMR